MAQQPPKIPPPAPVYQPYQQPPALKLDPGAQFTGQYSDTYTDQWGNPVPLETIRDPNNVKPSIPDYIPTWNNSFSVADHIQPALDQIQPDTSGLAAFSNEAKRSGPGAWAGLAQKLNQQEAKTQLDQAQRTSAGSTAQAESNLAMRGGLDSGARERLATAGSNQYASAAQSIGNTEATNATKINMQDEQNRIQELEALPGIQNQYLAPQFQKIQLGEQAFATDVQGQEANVTNLNAYNQNRFSTQAQMYGADQQATATRASGGGNWVVTELAKHRKLPADARRCLTAIRFCGAILERKPMAFYFKNGPELVRRLNEGGYDWQDFGRFVETLCELVRMGEVGTATVAYRAKIMDLMVKYWPECEAREFARQKKGRELRQAMVDKLPAPSMMGGKLAVQCGANIPLDRFEGYTGEKESSVCHG
jgi:hypothetical protein